MSLEIRHSGVTELADVVFPVAPSPRSPEPSSIGKPRARVRHCVENDRSDAGSARSPRDRSRDGHRSGPTRRRFRTLGDTPPRRLVRIAPHLASGPVRHHAHTGTGRGSVVELANVARQRPNARRRAQPGGYGTAPTRAFVCRDRCEIGADNGDHVAVSTESGSITLPLEITELPPRTVWLPLNSPGSTIYETLCVTAGSVVKIAKAGAQ